MKFYPNRLKNWKELQDYILIKPHSVEVDTNRSIVTVEFYLNDKGHRKFEEIVERVRK
jgi:type IV secretory pathway VirB9-like protein